MRNTGFHIGPPVRHYLKAKANSVPNRVANVKARGAKIDQTQFNPLMYLGGNHHNHNAATFLHCDRRLVAAVPALYLL